MRCGVQGGTREHVGADDSKLLKEALKDQKKVRRLCCAQYNTAPRIYNSFYKT